MDKGAPEYMADHQRRASGSSDPASAIVVQACVVMPDRVGRLILSQTKWIQNESTQVREHTVYSAGNQRQPCGEVQGQADLEDEAQECDYGGRQQPQAVAWPRRRQQRALAAHELALAAA